MNSVEMIEKIQNLILYTNIPIWVWLGLLSGLVLFLVGTLWRPVIFIAIGIGIFYLASVMFQVFT